MPGIILGVGDTVVSKTDMVSVAGRRDSEQSAEWLEKGEAKGVLRMCGQGTAPSPRS